MVAHRRIRHGTGTYEWHVKFRGNKGAVRMGADTRTTSLSDDVMIQSTDGGLTLIPPSPFSQITRPLEGSHNGQLTPKTSGAKARFRNEDIDMPKLSSGSHAALSVEPDSSPSADQLRRYYIGTLPQAGVAFWPRRLQGQ